MKKIGLILEGGGAKGAYQAGVMRAIAEKGVEFDGVAGTSIGAVNGALYVQGGVELMNGMWSKVNLGTVLDFDDRIIEKVKAHELDIYSLRYIGKQLIKFKSLLERSAANAAEFFKSIVSEEPLRASKKDFGVTVFNLSEMKGYGLMKEEIPEGLLTDYVIASATYPLFPPKVIENQKYIDGGVYDNIPINLLGAHGYDKMLVIRTNILDKLPRRKQEREDIEVYTFAPLIDLGHAMSFTSTRIEWLRTLGYVDAKRELDGAFGEFLGVK